MKKRRARKTDETEALRRARVRFFAMRVLAALAPDIATVRSKLRTYNQPSALKWRPGTDPTEFAKEKRELMRRASELGAELVRWWHVREAPPVDPLAVENLERDASVQLSLRPQSDPLRNTLQRAAAVAQTLPHPDLWREFYFNEVVPALEALESGLGWCKRCGKEFPRTRRDRIFCLDSCSAAARQPKRSTGKPRQSPQMIAVREFMRVARKYADHMAKCRRCQANQRCPEGARLEIAAATSPEDVLNRQTAQFTDTVRDRKTIAAATWDTPMELDGEPEDADLGDHEKP